MANVKGSDDFMGVNIMPSLSGFGGNIPSGGDRIVESSDLVDKYNVKYKPVN